MGILKNLLVTGAARFVNTIKGSITHAQNGIYYGTCSTAAGTAAKVVELVDPTGFELKPGVMIAVKYSVSNTASNVTLDVEGTGGKQVWYNNAVNTGSSNSIFGYANRHTYYVYDGTHWVWVNYGTLDGNSNTVPSAQCETAAATAAKAATITNYTLTANTYLHFNIMYANTASSALTMNVNSKGAKPIYINGTASSSSNHTLPAGTYIAFYDGTNWYFRTDGKLPADISGDSATTNEHTLGHDTDGNVVVAWDGGQIIDPEEETSPLTIAKGGTGATTAAEARTNLGLGSAATYNVISSVNNDSNLVTGAAIKNYIDGTAVPSAISTTVSSTAAKVATCSSYTATANSYIQVILANSNTASTALTLNINGTGDKPIYINNEASSSTNKTLPAGSYFVYYDGTNYYFRTDGALPGKTGVLNIESVTQSADTQHLPKTFNVELYSSGADYNLPSAGHMYYILTLAASSATVGYGTAQLALGYNTEGVYYRRSYMDGWTEWQNLTKHYSIGIPNVSKSADDPHSLSTFTVEKYAAGADYNLPTNHTYMILSAQSESSNYASQLALGNNIDRVFYRRSSNSGWTQWYNLIRPDLLEVANGGTGATDAATARTNLMSAGFPNYGGRQALHSGTTTDTSNITYSGAVSSNGFLQAYISTSSASGLPFMRLSIQNQVIYELGKYGNATAANYMYRWSPLFPVRSGDTYSFSLGASVSGASLRVYFYPDR